MPTLRRLDDPTYYAPFQPAPSGIVEGDYWPGPPPVFEPPAQPNPQPAQSSTYDPQQPWNEPGAPPQTDPGWTRNEYGVWDYNARPQATPTPNNLFQPKAQQGAAKNEFLQYDPLDMEALGSPLMDPPGSASPPSTSGRPPAGFAGAKFADEAHQSPKYIWGRAFEARQAQFQAIPDQAGREQFVQNLVTELIPQFTAAGMTILDRQGHSILVDAGDGRGPTWVDLVRDIEGRGETRWGIDAPRGNVRQRAPGALNFGSGGDSLGNLIRRMNGGGGDGPRGGERGGSGGGGGRIASRQQGLQGTLEQSLRDLIANQGNYDEQSMALRLEQVREAGDRMRTAQTETARNTLADRGLLSEPGIPQGAEYQSIQQIEEGLAPFYAAGSRDAILAELDAADERMMNALQVGAGYTAEQARTAVERFKANVTRQLGFADIAQRDRALQGQLGLGYAGLGVQQYGIDAQTGLGYAGLGVQSRGQDLDYLLGNRGIDRDLRGQDLQSQAALGQLALGTLNSNRQWQQFLSQHGLNTLIFNENVRTGNVGQMIQLLDLFLRGAGQSATGFRGWLDDLGGND